MVLKSTKLLESHCNWDYIVNTGKFLWHHSQLQKTPKTPKWILGFKWTQMKRNMQEWKLYEMMLLIFRCVINVIINLSLSYTNSIRRSNKRKNKLPKDCMYLADTKSFFCPVLTQMEAFKAWKEKLISPQIKTTGHCKEGYKVIQAHNQAGDKQTHPPVLALTAPLQCIQYGTWVSVYKYINRIHHNKVLKTLY